MVACELAEYSGEILEDSGERKYQRGCQWL